MKMMIRAVLAFAFVFTLMSTSSQAFAQGAAFYGFQNSFEGYWGGIGAGNQWQVNGSGGTDVGRGFARSGQNNGFIRGSDGWNALWIQVPDVIKVSDAVRCKMDAWIRSSGNVGNFYFTAFDPAWNANIWGEVGPLHNAQLGTGQWIHLTKSFTLPAGRIAPGNLGVRLGFWGYGADVWVQVDDVGIYCTNHGTVFEPATKCNESGCDASAR